MGGCGGCVLRPDAPDLGSTLNATLNPLAAFGRLAIRTIDRILRAAYQVKPFSQDPDCILRISKSPSPQQIRLSDGVQVQLGDPILVIHFWNERLGGSPQDRIALGWGRHLSRRLKASLRMLTAYLDQNLWANDIVAVRGELGFVKDVLSAKRYFMRLGFDVVPMEAPGMRFWRRAFWDNLYSYALMWTFNPGLLRGKRLTKLVRVVIWISRERLVQMYAAEPSSRMSA